MGTGYAQVPDWPLGGTPMGKIQIAVTFKDEPTESQPTEGRSELEA